MSRVITPSELIKRFEAGKRLSIDKRLAADLPPVLVDVRKPAALARSGRMAEGAVWRHLFRAADWAGEFAGHTVVVFCVHGHEVSQAVCGFLCDEDIACLYVVGGFEAMVDAGWTTHAADSAGRSQ